MKLKIKLIKKRLKKSNHKNDDQIWYKNKMIQNLLILLGQCESRWEEGEIR
jgi:hypothetical protein